MDSEVVKVTVACHCKRNQYSFEIDRKDLPFKPLLCSCDISRRISGVLCTSYIPVPSLNTAPDQNDLRAYKSSNILTRHFCSSCGTHMFLEYDDDRHWEVATGLVSNATDVQYQGHMWIEDTKDGGASDWIKSISSKTCSRWLKDIKHGIEVPLNWRNDHKPDLDPLVIPRPDKLHAHCHCGGVEFFVTRPNKESYQARSPFPDTVVAFTDNRPADNPDNEPWWISGDGKRYAASHCACITCRQMSGFDIVQWAFVPRVNLEASNGLPLQSRFGTLKSYESSLGVTRSFCDVCGANIFWEGQFRPTILDVAVGILDAESGTRAEEWLEWITGRVSFREEAHHVDLVEGLEKGLKDWQPLSPWRESTHIIST